jgi:hypothetical protein
MKMIIIGACVLFLGGCGVIPQKSEIPEQELLVDDKVHSMSRLEVMSAIQECQTVQNPRRDDLRQAQNRRGDQRHSGGCDVRTLVLILALLLGWVYHQEAMFRAEQRVISAAADAYKQGRKDALSH